MSIVTLRGITWNHSRAFPPLVAASQRYEELHPDTKLIWEKRSLDEFGHAGLSELARAFDLLIIDHPMLGDVHRDGTLLDLLPWLTPVALAELEAEALGPCLDSYRYGGRLYALPVDAAAPASSCRADLLDRLGCKLPSTWDELIALAHKGMVVMPGFPADLLLNFLGMCISREGMIASHDQLLDPAIAILCLEELRELTSFMPPAIYSMNPIQIHESMSSNDDFAYCPFAYTYSNYSRPGFAPQTLLFGSPVTLRGGTQLRTILGGTGIAISARCAHAGFALDFSLFVAGSTCQRCLYGICGGQPATKSAWRDPLLNSISDNFFARTIASLEDACIRPRYPGYVVFQRSAGRAVVACCQQEITVSEALSRVEEMYRSSLVNAT